MDIVFTIASRNYAAQARVLVQSLRQADPAVIPVIVATDGTDGFDVGPGVELLDVWSVEGVAGAMALYYDALEFNTSVKPFCFLTLLARDGVTSVAYLDPDILVLGPLDEVRTALADASIALTPHLTQPLAADGAPDDKIILRSGAYNLGFLGVGQRPDAKRLMAWWAERCRFDCRVDFEKDLFTDQRWMDLAPSLVEHAAILRDPGLNLAYWNLPHRRLEREGEAWTVNGRRLVFFHFSGFDPHRPDLLSRHQDRVSLNADPALSELLTIYAKLLLAQGYATASPLAYAHDVFGDGRRVVPPMRRRALSAARQGEALDRPSLQDSGWFDRADPALSGRGLPDLTRAVGAVCTKAGLPIETSEDRLAVPAALCARGGLGLDAISLEAQADLDAAFYAGERAPIRAQPSSDVWRGPASEVEQWLRGDDPTIAVPRAVAVLWRARRDLRTRFELSDAALIDWCLGPEAIGKRFAPQLLPPPLLDALDVTPGSVGSRAAGLTFGRRDGAPLRELRILYGLADRAQWPRQGPWFERRCALDRPDAARSRPFAFPLLLTAVWESRTDLQIQFDLRALAGRMRFVWWFVRAGVSEYGLEWSALPQPLRRHSMARLARLRSPRSPTRHAISQLWVREHADAPTQAPAGAACFFAATGSFSSIDGTGGPSEAETVVFETAPGLAAADFIAVRAHGVTFKQAIGAWSAAVVHGLQPDDPALGFVDAIWTSPDGVRTDLPRPVESFATV